MNRSQMYKSRTKAKFVAKTLVPIYTIKGMTTGEDKVKSILSNCVSTFKMLVIDLKLPQEEFEKHKNAMSELCKGYIEDNINVNHDLLLTKANRLTQMYVNAYLM